MRRATERARLTVTNERHTCRERLLTRPGRGWTRSRFLGTLGASLLVGAGILAGCSSSPAGSSTTSSTRSTTPGTTATAGAGLVSSYTTKNNIANASLNVNVLAQIEEGSAHAMDLGTYTLDAEAGYKTLDGSAYHPITFGPVASLVPRSSGYPSLSLEVTSTRTSPGTPAAFTGCSATSLSLLLFRKDSASSAWRVALEPDAQKSALPSFAMSGGYAQLVTSSAGLRAPLASLPGDFASDLAAYGNSGTLRSGFSASDFGSCWRLQDLRASATAVSAKGIVSKYSAYAYTPSDLTAFRLSSGDALVMFGLYLEDTLRASSGAPVKVTHTRGDPSTYAVAAGSYPSVVVPTLYDVAVIDPSASAGAGPPFTFLGANYATMP